MDRSAYSAFELTIDGNIYKYLPRYHVELLFQCV